MKKKPRRALRLKSGNSQVSGKINGNKKMKDLLMNNT